MVIGSKEAAEKVSSQSQYFMKYHSLMRHFSLSPLQSLMKNLNFKPVKRDPRLSAVQRTIWGMIRLIAVGIPAPVAGRGSEQGE